MMKRTLAILLLAFCGAFAAAQAPDAMALKALVDSNRVNFKYTLSAKDRPQIATSGTVVLDGPCYHLSTKGADIWCDGTTKWTVDSEAKEVYIESSEGTREFLTNPTAYLDKVEGLKVTDKQVSGVYNEPTQGAAVAFKLTSIKSSPLTGGTAEFFFDTSALGQEWVITDLR